MTKRIFRSILLVAGAVLLLSAAIIMGCLYDYFENVQEEQLVDELELAAQGVEDSGAAYLKRLRSERYRLTWVDADGTVLYDTQHDAAAMENHGDREEIREVLQAGQGDSVRYSSTLLEKTVYYARRISNGTALRISVSRASVGSLAFGMLQPVLIVLIVALILSLVLARRVAKRIVDPLNGLDLDAPLENDTYEELSPLLNRLNHQQQALAAQLQLLQQQRDEFALITDNMQEGLVLLDGAGAVVSINPTARRLFHADAACVGRDFLTVERGRDVVSAVKKALSGGHGEARANRAGRCYQFDVSRIESGEATLGAVLLAFDVTEQAFAERNRREFTANVSHELKTPLQSIIGSAELLEGGLVKPADTPRFIGHIKREATRLVTLIEDILRLSQLDEGAALPMEDVLLGALAEEVTGSLKSAAAAKDITLTVSGDATVHGVRRLLHEALYNLCDNAIKYNVAGGSVDIGVTMQGQDAVVTVKDTGIGIPEEHLGRVFERFYRVDKSHSKASGGTGLGLSIVKHAAAYHHGSVAVTSTPDHGSTFTLTLPAG